MMDIHVLHLIIQIVLVEHHLENMVNILIYKLSLFFSFTIYYNIFHKLCYKIKFFYNKNILKFIFKLNIKIYLLNDFTILIIKQKKDRDEHQIL